MSDDDNDYDFADLFFDDAWDTFDERSTVDDLVENVIPSPVCTSYDPRWDMESPKSDWEEYLGDGFFDDEVENMQRREVEKTNIAPDRVPRTRTPKQKNGLPLVKEKHELNVREGRCSLLEPTVVWRSQSKEPSRSPTQRTVAGRCVKTVSLLSDWREKFNVKPQGLDMKRQCHQNGSIQQANMTASEKLYEVSNSINNVPQAPHLTTEAQKHSERPTQQAECSIDKTTGRSATDSEVRENKQSHTIM